MKKLVSALLAGVMLTFSGVGVYADETVDTAININSANYNQTTGKVTVTGTVTNSSDSQIMTIMSTGIKENTFDTEQIVFIDQKDNVELTEKGEFSFDFALSDTAQLGTRYFVRIGGSNVSSPAYMAFNFSQSSGELVIVYGDVTADGVVTVDDASVLLKYVLDPSSVNITDAGFKNAQVRKQEVKSFTAEDAAMILQKAINTEFKFPAEK